MRTDKKDSLDGYRARPTEDQLRTELEGMGLDMGIVNLYELGEDALEFANHTELGKVLIAQANDRLQGAVKTLVENDLASEEARSAQVECRACLMFLGMIDDAIRGGATAARIIEETEGADHDEQG